MMRPFWSKQNFSSRRHLSSPNGKSTGFTLVEVIVGMMITLIFLTVTMQIFVSAAYLRAKAREYDEIYNWVQEDFEQILTKAKTYEMQTIPHSSFCATGQLASSFISDAAQGLGGNTADLGERTFGTRTMQLSRTASHTGTLDPSRLLDVTYQITQVGTGESILEIETKVAIYAAFNCPSP